MKRIVLLLFIAFPLISFSQEKVAWDYPVKPGSEEWRYTSYTEKLQKNQPPISLINKLSTIELLDLCLNYPFNKDILLFNNPNTGFEKVFSNSLCWQEYINRPDATATFLKLYDKYSTEDIEKFVKEDEKRNRMFNEFFLEKFVSETELINNTDSRMRKLLLKSLLDKHIEKKKKPNQFRGFSYWSLLSAIINVLKYEDSITPDIFETADYKSLKEQGSCYNPNFEAEIVSIATKRLEE